MHRLLKENKTGKKELKFHMRARGNNLGCLPVEVSFILDLDALLHLTSVNIDLFCFPLCDIRSFL